MASLRGFPGNSQAAATPAMPGACMVPAPGGGAGVTKRGRRNVSCTTSKKRRKAVVPNFGGQTGMLEAEIRVIRLLDMGHIAEAADMFLKSGGDADPCIGRLIQALLEVGNINVATCVARASRKSALLSQADVVRCLGAMPRTVQHKDGQEFVLELVRAASWSSNEHERHFRQTAESILLRFLQQDDSLPSDGGDECKRSDLMKQLQAIPCEDASHSVEPTVDPAAVQPLPVQSSMQGGPYLDSRYEEDSSSDIDADVTVVSKRRFVAKSTFDAEKTGESILVGAHVLQTAGALRKPVRDSPSPFLDGGVMDASSLGLISRGPLPVPRRTNATQALGALGLGGYGSSSGSEEADEDVSEG